MQTKYKLDKHIKAQALWVVRGYKAEQIEEDENGRDIQKA